MTFKMNAQIMVPSVVGVGKTDLGLLSVGKLQRSSRQATPYTYTKDGVTYLVGEGVEQFARPTERMDFYRLVSGPEMQSLTFVALTLASCEPKPDLSVMIGFPVEVMADRDLAMATRKEVQGWMLGSHHFTLNGKPIEFNITAIQIAAQPAGAYFAWGMDDTAQWVRSANELNVMVGICDVGFNTLDVFTVQGGQIVGQYTGGDTAGIRRAADLLNHSVQEQYGVKLSRHQADGYLRSAHPVLSCAAGDVDISHLTAQALNTTAAAIGDFLETLWGNGRQFRHILFTGGGAEMLKSTLLHRYPHGQVLPNPVFANALGLARYGCRVFKNAPTVIGLDPGFGGFKAVCMTATHV